MQELMSELGFRDLVYQPWVPRRRTRPGGLLHYPACVYLRGNYKKLTCVPVPGEDTGKEAFPCVPTEGKDGELAPAPAWDVYAENGPYGRSGGL